MTETGIYKVQKGDSALLIAKRRVIAQGKKATNANIILEAKRLAKANNCEDIEDFNKKFFSSVGLEISTISSPGNQPKPQGESTDDEAKEIVEEQPVVRARKKISEMNTVEKLKQNITEEGGKPLEISIDKLSQEMQVKINSYLNLYDGATPTVIKDKNTGDIYVHMNTFNTSKGGKVKMQSLNIKLNNAQTVVTRYFSTGKIAQDIENNYDPNKNRSILIQGNYRKQGAKKVITEPLDIEIKIDSDIYKNATSKQKKSIDNFFGALQSQKAQLMKDLNIDNDKYNRFAKLAVAIGMQETKLGTATSYDDWEKTAIVSGAKDSVALINSGLKNIGIDNPIKYKGINSTSVSKGITQIKIGDWIETPRIKELFNKYGITSGYYTHPTEEQSAAATIIILSELDKQVDKPEYKNGISAANKKYYAVSKELDKDGKVISHRTKQWKLNKITRDDAILYLYNGRSRVLRNGNATPSDNGYIASIRRNSACVKVYENNHQRAMALKNAKTIQPESINTTSNNNMPKMQKDLGWGIGQIAFMPKLYTSGVEKNSQKEIELLKSSLKARGVSSADVEKLARKLEAGEIAFVKGLTSTEISAMTDEDVKLLLKHSDSLNSKLSTIKTDATKRKYASDADREFKRVYLSSHAQQYNLSASLKRTSVKLNNSSDKNTIKYPEKGYFTGTQRRCESLLPQLRGARVPDAGYYLSTERIKEGQYMGYKIERDKGINTANASDIDIVLAKNGADAANILKTSGACLTGAKQGLIGSGAVSSSEMKNFNKAYMLAEYLEKHPERFIEITHIQISPTKAREITAGDIANLPAGCIVVFGNPHRRDEVYGHSGFTNGNGQIYGDEIDNSNWDNFTSQDSKQDGKGEHGDVRVFKLNPAYFQVDESGKKLIPKK